MARRGRMADPLREGDVRLALAMVLGRGRVRARERFRVRVFEVARIVSGSVRCDIEKVLCRNPAPQRERGHIREMVPVDQDRDRAICVNVRITSSRRTDERDKRDVRYLPLIASETCKFRVKIGNALFSMAIGESGIVALYLIGK